MIMDHQRTEKSTDGNLTTGSSGQLNLGSSGDCFSCPRHREVASGAGIFRQSWLIRPDHLLTALPIILTSGKPDVTLCVCLAPEPSTGVRFCVLDAEGKVITVLPETCVGTANRKPSGNGCYTFETNENMTKEQLLKGVTDMCTHFKKSSEKMESGSGCRDD